MKNDFLRSALRFVTIAEEGSIHAAAQRLNLAQPSLTLSIAKIEEGFGTRLFQRGKRGVTLTAAGQLLYPRAKAILAEGAMAQQEISDLIAGQTGRFHIRAGSSWGYCFMPEIVAGLKKQFPDLDVMLNVGNTQETFPQLLSGEVDAIIGRLDERMADLPGIGNAPLALLRFVFVCSQNHPLAHGKPISKRDLFAHPFVAYEPDVETLKAILMSFETEGTAPLNIVLRTRSPHAALELAVAGNFVACLSQPFVHKYKNPGLRLLKTDFPLSEVLTGILYRETLTPTDPFRYLMADLKRAAKQIEQLGKSECF